jgi:hypothetical protein
VLRCSVVRPRPVLLVVSRDVPQVARVKMLEQLAMFLPGGFARIGTCFLFLTYFFGFGVARRGVVMLVMLVLLLLLLLLLLL